MNYSVLPHFVRVFDRYSQSEQLTINEALEGIKSYLENGRAPYRLRIKRLSAMIYEARISIRLRITFYRDKDTVKFFCLGNHEDISRCLKRLRFINLRASF